MFMYFVPETGMSEKSIDRKGATLKRAKSLMQTLGMLHS